MYTETIDLTTEATPRPIRKGDWVRTLKAKRYMEPHRGRWGTVRWMPVGRIAEVYMSNDRGITLKFFGAGCGLWTMTYRHGDVELVPSPYGPKTS